MRLSCVAEHAKFYELSEKQLTVIEAKRHIDAMKRHQNEQLLILLEVRYHVELTVS